MAKVYISRIAYFTAAHRLQNDNQSVEWNKATFGGCNHENWHGHNYELEVTICGEPSPDTGFVMNLVDLKQILKTRIMDKCDHKNLNLDVDFLQGIHPTTENMCIAFWKEIEQDLPEGVQLHKVFIRETRNNSAFYLGE